MDAKQEICQDIVANCNVILERLKNHPATNETAEGRMIFQCRWLKEQISNGQLEFPVTRYVDTLKHVSAERLLEHIASNKDSYWEELGIYLYRLLYLIDGELLFKNEYFPFAMRCIKRLKKIVESSLRELTENEKKLVKELDDIWLLLENKEIEPPIGSGISKFPNFVAVDRYKPTIDDFPDGTKTIKLVANLIFNGIRPASWTSIDRAEIETTFYL